LKKIKIGRISGASGIRGEVKLWHDSGDSGQLMRLDSLFLCRDGGPLQEYGIDALRIRKKTPILKLPGVDDRNAAEALVGAEVWVDEERVRPTEEDAYLVSDLIGLAAVDADGGAPVGHVTGIVDNPAHDILQIETEGGASFLLPMVDVFIESIDLNQGIIFIKAQDFI
jgi:16S rRNA processing protein RimM